MLHVHIGPSPLALGLLVPVTLAAGFDVCLVGRPGSRNQREYGCASTGPGGSLRYHQVDWFESPERPEDLPGDLRARIASPEALLLTCTLRKAIALRRDFVEGLLRMRPEESETLLLPCENAPDSAYEEIALACDGLDVLMLRTVVNRMCIGREPDIDGRRMVFAHPLGEWLIERPAQTETILPALEAREEVSLVDDISARHDRKLWMVNGAHQALALMARKGSRAALRIPRTDGPNPQRDRDADDLSRSARDVEVAARLSHLHGAMDDALRKIHPDLTGNLDYAVHHVRAYSEHPDSIARVLEAFRRENLTPFIETLETRLVEAARICARDGRSIEPFSFVFDVFESLASDVDAFLDFKAIRSSPERMDAATDAAAVAAYARLTEGWMPEDEAEKRVKRLTKALSAHRQ